MALIGGAYIYYYFVCKRKLWFYANKITMEHESDLVQIGKYIELFYKEKHKYERKVIINEISPDVIKRYKDFVLVFEIKKSDKFKEAALWQLKYYLWYLKRLGLNVKGKLVIPEYNKEEYIELTEKDERKIKEILNEIKRIISMDKPPREVFKDYCKACAYYPLCWEGY
ncbi:NEQ021 [Nanoarchaeum equitans Kin4-M]|uniref:CRISPR-associated exonuclease Cas4 n=1 Tax=Nanoarchaeum equitans (strain Kin4-M) TaxID=228908 RepID=Q74N40_NANEQ|nr:NEQ021 [Nanoarchaeum equitans Kin4-M]